MFGVDEAAYGQCPLFSGMDGPARARALRFFEAQVTAYRKDDFLVRPGTRMTRFALVLAGVVNVLTNDINGRPVMMANASAGDTFGESLCYLQREDTPVYVCAAVDCRVLWMRAEPLRNADTDDAAFLREIFDRFIRMLARRTLFMNDRIQILSKGTLREKLTMFFSEYANKTESLSFDVPFDREAMAAYLAVNRSALSRELAAMRADGLIDFSHNHFTLHRLIEN